MIHAFGNSHANFFTNSKPNTRGKTLYKSFTAYPLGATIAYNFYEHHYPTIINTLNSVSIDKENDYIMLVVGEVDCRWHLPYQSHIQNKDYKLIVEECIDRFFRCHLDLKNNGYNVIAWGGHPSTNADHNDSPDNPIWGNVNHRNLISLHWNDYLEQKSKEHQIKFVSIIHDLISKSYITENNKTSEYLSTKMEYYMDYCHLSSDKYLDTVIKKFITLNLL